MFQKLLSLRRITSSGSYSPAIDGIRFIAIFFVLWQHSFERATRAAGSAYGFFGETPLGKLIAYCTPGVEIFFALSGYILYKGLRRAVSSQGNFGPGYLRKYFTRRVTRIEPPYVIAITAVFLFLLFSHSSAGAEGYYGKTNNLGLDYLISLFYMHNLVFGERSHILGLAWTLEIEVQFYLLAPLFAIGIASLRRKFGNSFGVFGILLFIILSVLIPPFLLSRPSILGSMPYFLGGILFAEVECAEFAWVPRGWWADLLGLVGIAVLMATKAGNFEGGFFKLIIALAACMVILGPLNGNLLKAFCSNAWIALFGGMCYSIYLVHLEVMEVIIHKTGHLLLGQPLHIYLAAHMTILITIGLFASVVFYLLIERPCMVPDWPSKLFLRLTGKGTSPEVQTLE